MRCCPILIVAASTVIASACSRVEPAPVVRTEIIRPVLPLAARVPCDDPAAVPDRGLTAREVASAWGRDRVALRTCETRRAAAVRAVDAVPVPQPRPTP